VARALACSTTADLKRSVTGRFQQTLIPTPAADQALMSPLRHPEDLMRGLSIKFIPSTQQMIDNFVVGIEDCLIANYPQ